MTSVLVCTTSVARDSGLATVTRALGARGADVVRLESDLFPTDRQLSIGWDRGDPGSSSVSIAGADGRQVDLDGVGAVWLRHTDTGDALPTDMDPAQRSAARLESDAMVWGLLECLDVFQLDPPEAIRAAPYKPRQLQLARRHGIAIPRTLVTNDPGQVRDFAKTCPDGMIAKLVDGSLLGADRTPGVASPFTRRIGAADLDQLGGLRFAPMIFQEEVPKALELRITAVGWRVFVAAVDSQVSTIGDADWRQDEALKRAFRPYGDCPPAIIERLLALLTHLGLNFATVDLIVTPDGRHVFLELNTLSYFDFVERATGLPISDAIADLLLGLAPSRIGSNSVAPRGRERTRHNSPAPRGVPPPMATRHSS